MVPRLPPHPAEEELHLREREARDRVRRGFSTSLVWYIFILIVIVLFLGLLTAYGLHWF